MKKYLNLLSKTQEEVYNHFQQKGFKVTAGGLLIDNKSKVTLVAHMDTVQTVPTLFEIREQKQKYYTKDLQEVVSKIESISSPTGLGADDRTGCFIIEKLFNKGNKDFNYLLLKDEEVGCAGAYDFCKQKALMLDTTILLVGLDREGYSFVDYNKGNTIVNNYIEDTFNVVKEHGSTSDVSVLSDNYNVPCINMGVGYFNQHTESEFQNFQYIQEVEEMILKIFEYVKDFDYLEIDTKIVNNLYDYDYFKNYKKHNYKR